MPWKSGQWVPSCSMWTDGQTNRPDETNSCFSKFCERTSKLISYDLMFSRSVAKYTLSISELVTDSGHFK